MAEAQSGRLRVVPIVLVALLVRLAIVWLTARAHTADWFFAQASELASLAESLRSGHGLSSPFGCCTGPSAFLAPGYPAIVAAFFAVFHPYSFASAVAIMLFQAACGAATVYTLMLLASRAFGNTAANLSGMIWALSPPAIFLPTLFWETNISILLATVLVLLALHCAADPSLRGWLLAALVAALSLAVNPSLLPIILCCLAWTLYVTRRRSLAQPLCAALVVLLLSAPWAIRNERQLHAFIPFRSNMGYELWQGNRPGSNGFFTPALHPNTSRQEFASYQGLGEVAYMHEKGAIALDAIRAEPARFFALTAKRAFYFWTGIVEHPATLVIAYIVFTTIGGFAGLILLWRKNKTLALLFFLPILLFPLPYYITHPDFRFRLVLDPVMVALMAYAFTRKTSYSIWSTSPSSTPHSAMRPAASSTTLRSLPLTEVSR